MVRPWESSHDLRSAVWSSTNWAKPTAVKNRVESFSQTFYKWGGSHTQAYLSVVLSFLFLFTVVSSSSSLSSDWLKKAYKRAQEQAKEEGRSFADIVAQRYGVSKCR